MKRTGICLFGVYAFAAACISHSGAKAGADEFLARRHLPQGVS